MQVTNAYSFLVHPGRGEEEQPSIGGTEIPPLSEVGLMLGSSFARASADCSIEIVFTAAQDGSQRNDVRESIIALAKDPSLDTARDIAKLLQSVTTRRSGLGLFFILLGKSDDGKSKIYLSRFPADNGITAEEYEEELKVELLEQVFMKNAYAYKAVVYEGSNFSSDFWAGHAIDKQVSSRSTAISGYWIKDFLRSDFKTTSALGTRRFAQALKKTIEETGDMDIKHELTALATLAKNFKNKVVSIDKLGRTFNLSSEAADALKQTLQRPDFAFASFTFSVAEFQKHIKFRQVHLNNGAFLTAPAGKFDQVFKRIEEPGGNKTVFSTEGKVIDESLTKRAK
jgi:hypothetical protein